MEQIEQLDVLYDFLYRDSNRIASYYAQIFHGHLSSMEKSTSERRNTDTSGKVDLHVISADKKITNETLEAISVCLTRTILSQLMCCLF